MLAGTRPTAINLRWALGRIADRLRNQPHTERAQLAWKEAGAIADEDAAMCESIGRHGLAIIQGHAAQKMRKLNILTHCNAGWLATVDWGTALAPIYMAHDEGIALHVWVDETRPRNQGAALTAFELGAHGVAHTIIADNAGGHYMQTGEVDMCIVGTDRVTANGDVANKIGTYLKALAAKDNGVPFYVALPSSTIDWNLKSGRDIPIEERFADELLKMTGRSANGTLATVEIAAPGSAGANPGFDVTPSRLVTGFITERGLCAASAAGMRSLFPENVS
jgi:methylthioribose-1-phosphate isomerase